MSIIAEWGYSSGPKATGRVVGTTIKDTFRLEIDKFADFDERANRLYLAPDRLDNWDEIKEQVEEEFSLDESSGGSNNNEEGSDSTEEEIELKAPRYSTKVGSKWVGLDDDGEIMTKKFDSHTKLKEEYNVESVSGFPVDDEKSSNGRYYSLNIPPEELT